MQLLKDHLLHSQTQPNSPIYSKKVNTTQAFVPFQRERDSMNRLLSAHSSRKKQSQSKKVMESRHKNKGQGRGKHFQKFNEYFKEQNVFAQTDNKKHKINKRSLIQLLSDQQQRKRPSTHNGKRQQVSRPSTQQTTQFNRFRKTKSVQMSRLPSSHTSGTLKRMHSTVIKRHSNEVSPVKKISPQSSPKKTLYYQPKINIQQHLNKYPQLNRINRMKQLQAKIFPDFEKNHNLFINKMIQSKQLAYQVKMDLNRIDDYY